MKLAKFMLQVEGFIKDFKIKYNKRLMFVLIDLRFGLR